MKPIILRIIVGRNFIMNIIYGIDLLGTMVFAISGAMAAHRQGIDIFGATFIGFVTAIGGGSLRDVFLNIRPVWVEDGNYLIAIFIGVFISAIANKQLYTLAKTLTLFDAIGIGFFTVVGTQKSLDYGSSNIAAIMLGMFSAAMGGVIRDTLMNETPLILRKEIYASACLSGASLFVVLNHFGLDNAWNAFISASLVVLIRLISVKYNLSLPAVKPITKKDD
ncbi:trimeric intracellular cation channel family protein [Sphingobacterium sp. Mn56C]